MELPAINLAGEIGGLFAIRQNGKREAAEPALCFAKVCGTIIYQLSPTTEERYELSGPHPQFLHHRPY